MSAAQFDKLHRTQEVQTVLGSFLCDLSKHIPEEFMDSVTCFRSHLIEHFVHLVNVTERSDQQLILLLTCVWWCLVNSPHAGHQLGLTLLWDGINQHSSQDSRRGCVGHSGTNSTPELMPQVFNEVEVRTAGGSFHPLHSDKP